MMEQIDLTTLREMQQKIGDHATKGLGETVERLLRLRDQLTFDDADWYDELTQHVATLDSASTFHPANEAEKRQLDVAVQLAVDQIAHLIRSKMS